MTAQWEGQHHLLKTSKVVHLSFSHMVGVMPGTKNSRSSL